MGDDLASGTGKVQREGRHLAPQIVYVENQVLRKLFFGPPDRPANPRIHQPILVAGGIDGLHPLEAEIPLDLGLNERRNEPPACCIDVDGNIPARPRIQLVQRIVDFLDWFVTTGERSAKNGGDANGVLIAPLHGFLGIQAIAVAFHRNEAGLNLPVPAELLPTNLNIDAHDHIGFVSRLTFGLHSLLPLPLQGHATQHAGFAGPGCGAAGGCFMIGRIPTAGKHVDAAHLQFRRLRVFILVDHVLVERVSHQLARFRLHPCGYKCGQIQSGIAIQHQLVVDQVVRSLRQHPFFRDLVLGRCAAQSTPGVYRGHSALRFATLAHLLFVMQHSSSSLS